MRKLFSLCVCLVVAAALLPACSYGKKGSDRKEQAIASRNLGEAYMGEGNYTKALRELLKAEQLNPNDPYLQNNLGLTYLAKGNPEKALSHFKRALERKPDYSPARNNLGTAYIAL